MKFCFTAPCLARWFAFLAGFVLVAAALGALALPSLIDSDIIKAKIISEFNKSTPVDVALGKISVHWFPRLTVLLEKIEISSAEDFRASIGSATLYPSLLNLLLGRLVVDKALLTTPRLLVRLPEMTAEPFDITQFENQVRRTLSAFARELPARFDFFGDQIVTEAETLFAQADGADRSMPRLEGAIRLKADRLKSNGYEIESLQGSADLSPAGIRGQIARGVICGITGSGSFENIGADVTVDLTFATTDGQLEATTVCLTDQRSDIRGKYNFKARINGRGDRAHLRSTLKGDFQFNARDGEFVRGAGMDATFDYLNQTGDFAVAFPDLNKQTFPFRALTINGRIDGESVLSDEIVLQASPYMFTGKGQVDLAKKQVDVKGLVSVALPVHDVIKRIPLIGAFVGGTLVGIPIRVSGRLERPDVAYLAPQDIGAELINVPLRILGSPFDALKLFVPSGPVP